MAAWTGVGWIGYAVIAAVFFGTIAVLDLLLGAGFCRQNVVLFCAISFAASTLICYPIGRHFNRHLPIKVLDIDWARKGKTYAHSTFFVRLEFAGLVGLPFHVLIAVIGLDDFVR